MSEKKCCEVCRKLVKTAKARFCSMACRMIGQNHPTLVDRDALLRLYAHYNCEQIGEMIGRDRKAVEIWLKRHSIPVKFQKGRSPNCRRIKKGDPNPMLGRKHSAETRRFLSEQAKKQGRMPYKAENGPPWKGKGGALHPNWRGGSTPERQAFYSSDKWKRIASAVRKRDSFTCQRCGLKQTGTSKVSFDVHHIVTFIYEPLRAEPTNLVYLCEPCHYWVHGPENTDKLLLKDAPVQEVQAKEAS